MREISLRSQRPSTTSVSTTEWSIIVAPVNWLARVHVVITDTGPTAYFRVADPTNLIEIGQEIQARTTADFDDIRALQIGLLQIWLGAGLIRTVYVKAIGHDAIGVLAEIIGNRGRISLQDAMTKAQVEYAHSRSQADGDSSIAFTGTGTVDGTVGVGTLQRLNESVRSVRNQVSSFPNSTQVRLEDVPVF